VTEWWLDVDRDRERQAVRSAGPNGGCVILIGDARSGRRNALRLLASEAEDAGYESFALAEPRQGVTLKHWLLGAWKMIAPPLEVGIVRPWEVPGPRLSVAEIVAHIASTAAALDRPVALLFDSPDRYERLARSDVDALLDLARQTAGLVVVATDTRSRTKWHSDPMPQIIRLEPFRRDDVVRALMAAPMMTGKGLDDLAQVADLITGGADEVDPDTAYARLVAWGMGQ
jgi:hypothetical protein